MKQIQISNFTIEVVRKDIKNMHLAVYPPTGRIRLAAPLNVTDNTMRLFAISKLAWIKRHQRSFQAQERLPVRTYVERESHYFQGKRYLLRVNKTEGPAKVIIKTKTYIDLYIKHGATAEKRAEVMNNWYRATLKEQIPEIIEKWSAIIGVTVQDWHVKQMRRKWGTCNIEAKRIWLNLDLAQKPIVCLEYIIVHEMVHLLERYHNDRFIAYMDQFLPNWRHLQQELNHLPLSYSDCDY